MSSQAAAKVCFREICSSDLGALADLLTLGFPVRTREYWLNGFRRLGARSNPKGPSPYGWVMVHNEELVGVILLINSSILVSGQLVLRSNLSSWFVKPAFRSLANVLVKQATRRSDVTYLNISPAPHTWRTIEAQGFKRYSNGQFVALPIARATSCKTELREVGGEIPIPFEGFERDLLLDHHAYGCLALWCSSSEGDHPFVFLPRKVKRLIPCYQLIYCRNIDDYVRFARPLGRFMVMRGRPFVLIDANGAIPGLKGRFFPDVSPKYFKGPDRPRLGDLSYTEAPIFGL